MPVGAPRAAFAALTLFAASGCGKAGEPPYRLEGSLTVLMDLRFDQARIEINTDQVSVRFLRKRGDGEDLVFHVAASLSGTSVEPNVGMDLAENTPLGTQRGAVFRNVLDDPRRTFPPLERGRLLFRRAPISQERVSGEVSVTFKNGTEFASGRTVFGTFEGEVQ